MKLPHPEQAVVPERKVVAYLLSFTHPDGKSKAAFFSRFGFTAYTVEGRLHTPDGRDPAVRVVWFVEPGQEMPRLITSYPEK